MYKSRLQEQCQQKSWALPKYNTVKDGLDHNPCFRASVTVNGVSFHAPTSKRSLKEAQNEAAKIAFDYFTMPIPVKTISVSSSDSSLSTGTPPANEDLSGAHSAEEELESIPQEMQNLYKNQLQNLSQRKNNCLPVYDSICQGHPHAPPRFKATVTVDGQTFKSPKFFMSRREAEYSAAKVALASLSLGTHEEEAGAYKNLLQELTQKEGFALPEYDTVKSGASHLPTFISTVEINGEIFSGKAAKSKKQAEMSAAKAAWGFLKERSLGINRGCFSVAEAPENSFSSSQPGVTMNFQQNLNERAISVSKPNINPEYGNKENTVEDQEGGSSNKTLSNDKAGSSDQSLRQPHTQDEDQESGSSIKNLDNDKAGSFDQPLLKSDTHAKLKLPSECSQGLVIDQVNSEVPTIKKGSSLLCNRILVHSCQADMVLPEGATPLPFGEDMWIAVQLDSRNQKGNILNEASSLVYSNEKSDLFNHKSGLNL